jgi:hypothetical protein
MEQVTTYISLLVISELQSKIMLFVDYWVKDKKTPTPREEIIKAMEKKGWTSFAVKNALFGLLNDGYLRKAIMDADTPLNKTFYVQLRRV